MFLPGSFFTTGTRALKFPVSIKSSRGDLPRTPVSGTCSYGGGTRFEPPMAPLPASAETTVALSEAISGIMFHASLAENGFAKAAEIRGTCVGQGLYLGMERNLAISREMGRDVEI